MRENKCDCIVCIQERPAVRQQSAPTGDGTVIVDELITDLQARKEFGTQKYGTPLRAHNGRNALLDAYQEALDLVIYLKQCLVEQGIDV